MRFLKNIPLLSLLFPCLVSSQVTIHEFPKNLQLYKRDVISNMATVQISGTVEMASGVSLLTLDIYKDQELIESIPHPLSYENDMANFQFSKEISAGLFQYRFKLKTDVGDIVREVSGVVAGDIYILTGQSNSIRNTFANTPFPFQDDFIRTYLLETQEWSTNPNPFIFGGIGYRFAASIVNNQNIPVLVLNGGEGGKRITHFPRNDEHSTDITTNYGRLLSRYRQANFTSGDVKGIVWFQGESNALINAADYTTRFNTLYDAWEEDYAPAQYYIFQVRYGCPITGYPDYRKIFQPPEIHRKLGLLPKTKIISTNAVTKGPDNCHYYGTDGYEVLATRLYNLVAYDFYDAENDSGIYSPNIDNVRFTNTLRNQIKFDLIPATDQYTWQNGVEHDFWIEGNTDIEIISGSVFGSTVTLNLSENSMEDHPKLSYLGHNPNDRPFIVNQNGIGMLSFKGVDISNSSVEFDEQILNDLYIYPNPATATFVTIQWKLLKNSNIVIYDITGKKVFNKINDEKQQLKIDVSDWSSGQYIIKIINQSGTTTKMLIVN